MSSITKLACLVCSCRIVENDVVVWGQFTFRSDLPSSHLADTLQSCSNRKLFSVCVMSLTIGTPFTIRRCSEDKTDDNNALFSPLLLYSVGPLVIYSSFLRGKKAPPFLPMQRSWNQSSRWIEIKRLQRVTNSFYPYHVRPFSMTTIAIPLLVCASCRETRRNINNMYTVSTGLKRLKKKTYTNRLITRRENAKKKLCCDRLLSVFLSVCLHSKQQTKAPYN